MQSADANRSKKLGKGVVGLGLELGFWSGLFLDDDLSSASGFAELEKRVWSRIFLVNVLSSASGFAKLEWRILRSIVSGHVALGLRILSGLCLEGVQTTWCCQFWKFLEQFFAGFAVNAS